MLVRGLCAAGALALAGCVAGGAGVEAPGDMRQAWFGLAPPGALANPPVAPDPMVAIPEAVVPAGEEEGRRAAQGRSHPDLG